MVGKRRKGRAPTDSSHIWLQLGSKGLRIAFNQKSFEHLGQPERVVIEIQAEGFCFTATDYPDEGYKIVRNNASWMEICSEPLWRKYLVSGFDMPMGAWLLAEQRDNCLFLSVDKKMDCNALAGSQSGLGSQALLSTDSSELFQKPLK